jgi:hypothetical protein
MSRRYLFGPSTAAFADQKLHPQRKAGACLTYNPTGDADLLVRATDDWQTIAARFPAGWQPDFIVLNLGYTCVPACLWTAPVPLIGLAPDWNLLWHAYRHRLRQCDLVLTDTLGVETLLREGIPHALAANLFGCDRSYVEEPWPEVPRDLDILFVGNFNPAVQRQRLPWLARVARLAGRRNVLLAGNVFGADYRRLLARARIVFNYANRGECNLRVFEAAAAGALLFQEEGNREVPALFRHRQECVYYNSDNLESVLDHFLEHEDERRPIAEAARAAVRQYAFSHLWEQHLERIEAQWPALQERARLRFVPAVAEALRGRTWEVLGTSLGDDPNLAQDLRRSLARRPDAALRNALGVLAGQGLDTANSSPQKRWRKKKKQPRQQDTLPPGSDASHPEGNGKQKPAALALAHFRTALAREPADVLAGLNAAEALDQLGKVPQAVAQARAALRKLEESSTLAPANLDVCHFPPAFDLFRVEWERAAWTNAGQSQTEAAAKRDLLRWRLHGLLAEWTGDLEHYRQAQQARPDLWPTSAALGCAFGRAGRPADAVVNLRAALADNPFDAAAAQALFHALGECGDTTAQQALAAERRSLAAALGQNESPPPAADAPAAPAEQDGWLQRLSREEFHRRFGSPDTGRALCGYTNAVDTRVVLTLLLHARPRRVLEIGTALGHMTANLTEWTPDDAVIFSLGTTADLAVPTAEPQRYETPQRQQFGCLANAFGKVAKVCFITADSLTYDFARLGGIDFAFIDGAHDSYQGDRRRLPLLQRSLHLSHEKDSIVRKLYALLVQCHRRLGQGDLELAACRKAREFFPDDVELLFQEGLMRRERGDRAGARACWTRLLRPRPAQHFASIDTGLCGYKARHNLAVLSLEEGDLAGAEAHWRAAVQEQPGFAPARLGLGEVYRRQRRWTEFEQAAGKLAASGQAL